MLSAGLRSGAGATLRLSMWAAGSTLAGGVARELARVGPRHEDGPAATASRTALWINAAAGGAVAYALLGSVARGGALSPPRRLLYATMGSMAGVMLPQAMALAGPAVRRQLLLVLGGDGAGKARA